MAAAALQYSHVNHTLHYDSWETKIFVCTPDEKMVARGGKKNLERLFILN